MEKVDTQDPEARAMMAALLREDASVMEIKRQLDAIRIEYQMSSRKLAALRDLFIEKFKVNPYAFSPIAFGAGNDFVSEGQLAFFRMNPGEAAKQVLMAKNEPLTMDEIIADLRRGGLPIMDSRTVNAALMNTSGIGRNAEGKYYFEELEEIPEAVFE